MTGLIIPLDLFDDLVENTEECLNNAINNQDDYLINIYQKEIDRCKKIQRKLSNDN